ncbi:MAG: hypothetical protein GF416_05970 [Candidatus Altiarchaeales archaeon]|nr:hypothetical protein [Candidatus Altiarchaeales archaeon]MBD3416662.1 hypothetical protein [Candidatus Altiarchaeales archaeon]
MKDAIKDMEGLREHMKSTDLKFREAILEYYRKLGEKQGFTVVQGSSAIRKAVNFGKLDLAWVEPNIVFTSEFGLLDDIYKHLWRVMVLKPCIAVLLLSGNSRCNPGRVKEIVEKTEELNDVEFIILDVSNYKAF